MTRLTLKPCIVDAETQSEQNHHLKRDCSGKFSVTNVEDTQSLPK